MPNRSLDEEYERLGALSASCLLDTPPEERFDRLTRLAAQFFDVPIALVSLVDGHRQWFKSRYGLAASETPRSDAFCAFPVQDGQLLIVEDASQDPRFARNPLVTSGPLIRFYAGQPVFSADGYALGTLCIIDVKPRRLDSKQIACLKDFAQLVQDEIGKVALAVSSAARKQALIESEAKLQNIQGLLPSRANLIKVPARRGFFFARKVFRLGIDSFWGTSASSSRPGMSTGGRFHFLICVRWKGFFGASTRLLLVHSVH